MDSTRARSRPQWSSIGRRSIYTIPTFQNPSGTTLPAERRQAVAQIAERHGIWVIEDEPYRELRYGASPAGADRLPLARKRDLHRDAREDGRSGTAGRLDGGAGRGRRIAVPVKQAMDINTSSIDQAAAAIYLENVDWARRTAELRAVYGDGDARRCSMGSTRCCPGLLLDAAEWWRCSCGCSCPTDAPPPRSWSGRSSTACSSCPARCSSQTSRTTRAAVVDLQPHAGDDRRGTAAPGWARDASLRLRLADDTRPRAPRIAGRADPRPLPGRDRVYRARRRAGVLGALRRRRAHGAVPADLVDHPLARAGRRRSRTSPATAAWSRSTAAATVARTGPSGPRRTRDRSSSPMRSPSWTRPGPSGRWVVSLSMGAPRALLLAAEHPSA